jgi:hypothetical protein
MPNRRKKRLMIDQPISVETVASAGFNTAVLGIDGGFGRDDLALWISEEAAHVVMRRALVPLGVRTYWQLNAQQLGNGGNLAGTRVSCRRVESSLDP